MAVTLTESALAQALRVGDSDPETVEVTRLREFAIAQIERWLGDSYETTPAAIVNESCVRLSGYLFDQPYTSARFSYANAMRNSGASRILEPWREHRAGIVGRESAEDETEPVRTRLRSSGHVDIEPGETVDITVGLDGRFQGHVVPHSVVDGALVFFGETAAQDLDDYVRFGPGEFFTFVAPGPVWVRGTSPDDVVTITLLEIL